MALKKKIRIENETAFKLEFYTCEAELKVKEFNSYKAMEQFHNRQTDFLYIDCNRYAFVNGEWHRFIKLTSPIIFQQELDFIYNTVHETI